MTSRYFKESKITFHAGTHLLTEGGYQGLKKFHPRTQMPKRKTKRNPLTKEDK